MKKHQKHANIKKLSIGEFHTNEYAILGTPCGNIKKLAYDLISSLESELRIGYVDADHKSADDQKINPNTSITYGAGIEYVDKINYHRFDSKLELNSFDFKQQFSSQDLVLVNGNHFKASQQIIVIDPKKPLEKKLDKLTNVVLILFHEGQNEIPDYLQNHIKNISDLPQLSINEIDSISEFIRTCHQIPTLNGLVLAGGKSERMKRDKGTINYHGIDQRLHMQNLLSSFTSKSFISIRREQSAEFEEDIPTITDKFIGLGPYGAILSAFQSNPNAAWLVTACDQPLLDEKALQILINKRNTSKLATAFYNSETNFPEPLITIWEPRAYSRLLYFLSLGYSCPRKVLINSEIEVVKLEDEKPLRNANTPEEFEALSAEI